LDAFDFRADNLLTLFDCRLLLLLLVVRRRLDCALANGMYRVQTATDIAGTAIQLFD
jgi:hypothetical protein